MSNVNNLRSLKLSHDEAVKNGRKGGKASGAAKRKRSELLRNVQDILDGVYIDEQGNEVTGADQIALTLYSVATDAKNRQCITAMRLLFEIMGTLKSDDEKKRDKLINRLKEKEIELTQKKIETLDGGIWE